ncbi:CaiB/BaiF CoA transferase family protein [Ureibacillus aquaedulcis]|uniref:CaiB/BaiF CoA-transferase family protein n=1 Tax=Ureibacillus aquaedulcis TaxID=3058421 RepID=A0ABT8GW20_9BACL|nr:CaiB/BaiF CoA-transferase family protein [Ureibacillus sp. BA0131]MDN4495602.1 CaiB/BaiF CoA-transferase family protein [Ureibacillus sp. BA0131]
MTQENFGPLTGLTIIDASSVIAAPFAACLLGDLGAEVIKIELPGKGDSARSLGPWKGEESLRWPGLSRNKRSLTLDIRTEEGREIFKELVKTADAVIENFRPGTFEKWGLGYDVLKEVNPNIVLTRQSGYGQTGPYAEKAGFGTPCTAFSGYTYLQGYKDRPPVSPSFSLLDYVSGLFAAFGTVSALYHRDKNNAEGQVVELGLYEAIFRMMEFLIAEHDQLGKVRERNPMLAGHSSPAGTYQTKDGKWVVLVCSTERTWTRLAESMGRADLIDNPLYKTNKERMQNDEELQKIVKEFIGSLNNDELIKKLDTDGVPISPILSIEDIFNNPQYEARENILEVEHPRLGSVKVPGIVPKFSATPGKIRYRAPELGEHNEEILRNEIGLTEEQIQKLYEKGVI